jgi:hypothetical protein
LFSRTDATSNVIVGTYSALAGTGDAGAVAAAACPRAAGTARATNPTATSRGVNRNPDGGRATSVIT